MEEYLVPTGYGEDEFVEKKSRFIGRVWKAESEEEALDRIQQMKKQANHKHTDGRDYQIQTDGAIDFPKLFHTRFSFQLSQSVMTISPFSTVIRLLRMASWL